MQTGQTDKELTPSVAIEHNSGDRAFGSEVMNDLAHRFQCHCSAGAGNVCWWSTMLWMPTNFCKSFCCFL